MKRQKRLKSQILYISYVLGLLRKVKMKVGLYNLEPTIVNTAMMQVSQYHKNQGDDVEQLNHLFKHTYDKIYAFSIFKETPKYYITPDMLTGGSGFNIKHKLPSAIEGCDYDWSLYPYCDYSIIWFSRGCIRKCPFCIVYDKEGFIHAVKPKNLNPYGEHIKVFDNNFFANPTWRKSILQLKKWAQPVEFHSGIDIRIFKKAHGLALQQLKIHQQIAIAWDNPKDSIERNLQLLLKFMKPYRIKCYILIGYWSSKAEDMARIELLRKYDIDPFAMPYNKTDPYQMHFARWVNRKEIFNTVAWKDYKRYKDPDAQI